MEEEEKKEQQPVIENPLLSKRQPGEDFWAYKERMKLINKYLRDKCRGMLVWNSKTLGTYVKPENRKKDVIDTSTSGEDIHEKR